MSVVQQYDNEIQSAQAFDDAVTSTGLFVIYREVSGTLLQPRPGQVDKGVRIDRVLVPTSKLTALGWGHGIIGVEIKSGLAPMGPAIAQAMDYTRCVFTLPISRFQIVPSWVFVWPLPSDAYGPLASILAQNRIGSATSSHWMPLQLKSGNNILRVSNNGTVAIGTGANGNRVGSR